MCAGGDKFNLKSRRSGHCAVTQCPKGELECFRHNTGKGSDAQADFRNLACAVFLRVRAGGFKRRPHDVGFVHAAALLLRKPGGVLLRDLADDVHGAVQFVDGRGLLRHG